MGRNMRHLRHGNKMACEAGPSQDAAVLAATLETESACQRSAGLHTGANWSVSRKSNAQQMREKLERGAATVMGWSSTAALNQTRVLSPVTSRECGKAPARLSEFWNLHTIHG